MTQALLWESQKERTSAELAQDGPALNVDVDGFEGPLDLLLVLARSQKVDLAKISILALAEQYLEFIQKARNMRLELAADYLVMAAWLAYLKSRLLLPDIASDEDEPSGEQLAVALAFRLRRLEAMRDAAAQLMARSRLGLDVFARGAPEQVVTIRHSTYVANLYDLLTAYASQKQRNMVTTVHVKKRSVWSLQEARDLLVRMMGTVSGWTPIDDFLVQYFTSPEQAATVRASSFSAGLELVREGLLEMRQVGAFEPIFVKAPDKPSDPSVEN
ncbi:MAG: segregation/condensation protein A [Rhizobiales bacterium]|nr:segregation/condensation protein A [Hyphomicrobiales bacterium]